MKKRLLSMLLAIVMVVGLLPTTAFAAESVAAQDLGAGAAVTIGHTLYTNAGTTTLTLTPDGENNVTVSGVTSGELTITATKDAPESIYSRNKVTLPNEAVLCASSQGGTVSFDVTKKTVTHVSGSFYVVGTIVFGTADNTRSVNCNGVTIEQQDGEDGVYTITTHAGSGFINTAEGITVYWVNASTSFQVKYTIGEKYQIGDDLWAYGDQIQANYGGNAWLPQITTDQLPAAKLGKAYSQTLSASVTVSQWNLLSGTLPSGLSLDSNGTISGTPMETGSFPIIVTAQSENHTNVYSVKEFTIVVEDAEPPSVTPPTANDLTYNGEEQALVSEGVVTDGTMKYALGENAPADESGWSTEIPTATDAGAYTVWYKAGSSIACVEVTVEQRTITVSAGNYLVSKFYDGTTAEGGPKGGHNLNIEGIVPDDSVQVTVTLPKYTDPNVGGQSKMTIGLLLMGDNADNYKLNTTSLEVDCEILPLPLVVTAKSYVLEIGSDAPDLTADVAYTITGFKDGMTADSMGIATPTLSYNASPDMSKAGTYSINVDVSEMSAQNYEITCVNGTLEVVECIHEFTDFALGTVNTENDSIFARCSKGCEEYKDPAPVLTLIAPENAVYERGLGHTASLAFDSQLGDQSSESIVYGPADKLTEGSAIDAGTYTASYTYNGLTAGVSYEVAQRPLTIEAEDKSVYVGDSAPEYTYIVIGWGGNYNAEDETDHTLSGVTVSCDSADLTSAGSYEITLSGTPVVNGYNVEKGEYDASANYSFTMKNGTLTVINDSAPGGGDSDGGGGYTPPAQNVNVPISGDTNTIHVGASVSGDKAVIDKVDLSHLDTVIGDHVDTGTVTIDFSGLDSSEPITTVELPADVVKQIAEAVNVPGNDAQSLEIVLSNGLSIEFDAVALGEMAAQADGLDITISIQNSKDAKLNQKQEAALKGRPAYDITVTSGGEHISDMGGKLTVHAPYELQDGEHPRGIIVWYVDEDGKRERCETSYDPVKKRVNWKTDHLSLYMIDYDESFINPFADISEDKYYYDTVLWALDEGITKGTSATTFSPDASCTRAQMATFLWRAAGSPEPKGNTNPFTDVSADAYYAKAVQWAVEQGITVGTSATTFSPDADCTRAQMATFLWRNAGSPATAGSTNPFADVSADAYYAKAVQWAVEQGITDGTGATTFSPDADCTRAQMVTFLYRCFEK